MGKARKKSVLLVIPAYNEAGTLDGNVRRLHGYLSRNVSFDWAICIAAYAGSTDGTVEIARRLAKSLGRTGVEEVALKGKGNAVLQAWSRKGYDVYAFTDADLSCGVGRISDVISAVLRGSNAAVGSRYMEGASAERSAGRLVLSLCFNRIMRLIFRSGITDFACGLKAFDGRTVRKVLPRVKDRGWFFDSEMLLLAERSGCRIKQLAVEWTESPVTRVGHFRVALGYVKNIATLRLGI